MLKRLRDTLVAALFGAFVLLFGIAVWSASSCEPNDKKQNSGSNTAPVQISCKPFNIGSIQSIGVNLGRHPEAVAAIITAFATGVIAWFTVTLSRVGKQQTSDARIIERAYINVVAPECLLMFDQQGTFHGLRVWVVWKNAGKTPAFPMFGRIGVTFAIAPEHFAFGQPPAAGITDPMVLGPGAQFTSNHLEIGAIHVTAALARTGHQFFWGEARYRDNFPGNPEHVMEFCYKLEIEGEISQVPGACRVRFNLYGSHNRYYDEPT